MREPRNQNVTLQTAVRTLFLLGAAGANALANEDIRDAPAPAFAERSLQILHIPLFDFGPADPSSLAPGASTWVLSGADANSYVTTWHVRTVHAASPFRGRPVSTEEVSYIHEAFGGDLVLFINGEVARSAVKGRLGLTRSLSLSVEIPYIWHGAAWVTNFVEAFHRALGEAQNGRDEFPAGRLTVVLQAPNRAMTFLDFEPRSGIGDVTATLSWRRPRSESGWTLGADLAGKAPTGSASSFDGSGGWDGGLLLFALCERGRWTLEGDASVVVPGGWKSPLPLDPVPAGRLLVSAIYDLGRTTRMGLSVILAQSPFRNSSYGPLSETGMEFGLGIERDLGPRLAARFTVREHGSLSGERADFGVGLALRYR
jgi:hypothetical protein